MTVQIEEMPSVREGISFLFTGSEPDSDGEPTGEQISRELVLPPLNLDSLRRLGKPLEKITADAEGMETVVTAISHALRRNYRGVPRWLIEQSLDVANMQEMCVALMDISGLRRKQIEEEKKTVAIATPSSPGTSSTPTSS